MLCLNTNPGQTQKNCLKFLLKLADHRTKAKVITIIIMMLLS